MTVPREERPSWLQETCPRWCTRTHDEGDHPDDRVHQGEAVVVPAVLLRAALVTEADAAESAEIVVRRLRAVGSTATWVQVTEAEDTRRMLMIDEATAGRLAAALRRVGTDP